MPAKILPILLVLLALLPLAACGKKSSHKAAAAPQSGDALPVLSNPIDNKSVLVIGNKYLAATKIQAAADTPPDPAFPVFQSELYPLLQAHCGASCHAVNSYPFASDGAPLAFETAKKYITANPDDSQMLKNIKAGHNGTKPEWAPEVAAAMQKVKAAQATP